LDEDPETRLTCGLPHRLWPSLTSPQTTALASAAIGFSFVSNFAFAFVDDAALLAILAWAIYRRGTTSTLRVLAAAALPVLAVSFGICGYTLTHYTSEHLWYGARSLSEMAQSLLDACLYKLPPCQIEAPVDHEPRDDSAAAGLAAHYLLCLRFTYFKEL